VGLVIGDIVLTLVYGAAMLILIPRVEGSLSTRPHQEAAELGIPSLASGSWPTAVFRVQELIVAGTWACASSASIPRRAPAESDLPGLAHALGGHAAAPSAGLTGVS